LGGPTKRSRAYVHLEMADEAIDAVRNYCGPYGTTRKEKEKKEKIKLFEPVVAADRHGGA